MMTWTRPMRSRIIRRRSFLANSCTHEAGAQILVTPIGIVVVTLRGAEIVSIVVPATAPADAVRTRLFRPSP